MQRINKTLEQGFMKAQGALLKGSCKPRQENELSGFLRSRELARGREREGERGRDRERERHGDPRSDRAKVL